MLEMISSLGAGVNTSKSQIKACWKSGVATKDEGKKPQLEGALGTSELWSGSDASSSWLGTLHCLLRRKLTARNAKALGKLKALKSPSSWKSCALIGPEKLSVSDELTRKQLEELEGQQNPIRIERFLCKRRNVRFRRRLFLHTHVRRDVSSLRLRTSPFLLADLDNADLAFCKIHRASLTSR